MINVTALVLLSGGQDSSTCLFWAKNEFSKVMAVGFDYNQRHKTELEAAKTIASEAGVSFQILKIPLLNELTENALTRNSMEVDNNLQLQSLPNTFVDGRNMLFLTYAAIFAKKNHVKHLIAGMGQTDYSGYPDCRDVFVKSLNVTLNLAMAFDFVIHTPLMFLSKAQTWEMADKLGILHTILEKTVTCYNGIEAGGCGNCPACKLRKHGLDGFFASRNIS